MHFELADLRLVSHIAEMENLTRGANKAALSPAAASARLKALENQLGSRLFYRSSKGLTLTSAGETLMRHARIILQQVDYIKSEFTDQSGGQAGHLRIYANTTAVISVLPTVLAEFMSSRPHVTVDLQEKSTREAVRGILDSAADFAIVAGPVEADELQSICFSTDRLVLVTPLGHPLANSQSLEFVETLEFPHIGLKDSTLHAFLNQIVARLEKSMRIRVLMSGFEAMCKMVEAGVGIGIVPESTARGYQKTMQFAIIPLRDEFMQRERRVLFREMEALPAAARAFIELLLGHSMQ
ncbi:LysR substrate-binding domain-containing protein [Acidovorax sp. MR-S7]|uniref:LysR substrate-binding domain-containing protein n=1 Tax=Acidovorax sp. MR-S7 TaxID=1268622 RepID=UPI0005506F11|nr:LysR substrate-binding domain-containing protein [Acidovorax sp. MR-S7]